MSPRRRKWWYVMQAVAAWVIFAAGMVVLGVATRGVPTGGGGGRSFGFVVHHTSGSGETPGTWRVLEGWIGRELDTSYQMNVWWSERPIATHGSGGWRIIGSDASVRIRTHGFSERDGSEDLTGAFRALQQYIQANARPGGSVLVTQIPSIAVQEIVAFQGTIEGRDQRIARLRTSDWILLLQRWYPTVVTVMLLAGCIWFTKLTYKRYWRGRVFGVCKGCGYSLAGLRNRKCPECGRFWC